MKRGRPRNPPLPPFPKPPTPTAVRAARHKAGLTLQAAGAVIYVSQPAWYAWEAGINRMPPGMWELWLHKTAHLRGPAVLKK